MKRSNLLAPAALLAAALAAERAAAEGERPTFHRDVAPILQRSCQVCHRPGEIGPFALEGYQDALDWSAMIEEVVAQRRMPPWHADPAVGRFANDRRLPDAERRTIMEWVAGGSVEGDPADAPPPIVWPDPDAWRIGEPDAVLAMPRTYRVPAHGAVAYQYFDVRTDFGEDKWVRAMEVRVGAPEVVHHVLVFVIYPDRQASPQVLGGLQGFFASALPGDSVSEFPEGAGKLLPQGATLRFQVHYTPDGVRAREDLTRLGLRFAAPGEEVTRRLRTVALFQTAFAIPPGAPDHEVRARYLVREDALLTGLLPHMHLRGKSFRYVLQLPDGSRRPLLDIPRWDFNWQRLYRLAEPIFLPRGSAVLGIARYDNSEGNPANPDPTAAVRFGEQTWDEMMIGYLDLLDPTPEERAAGRRSLRAPRAAPPDGE